MRAARATGSRSSPPCRASRGRGSLSAVDEARRCPAMRSLSATDPRRGDAHQPELDLQDVAGEAHAARRWRGRGRAPRSRRALHDAAVGHPHAERAHVGAEAAVRGGGSCRGRRPPPCPPRVTNCVPGVTGGEEAARQEEPVQLEQREAGLRAQHARRRVEGEDAVGERRVRDHRAGWAAAATSRRRSGRGRGRARRRG